MSFLIKYLLIFLFLFTTYQYKSQINLIPNPGFENYSVCPFGFSQISTSINWFSPSVGTPDLYNSCSTFINYNNVPYTYFGVNSPFSGNGYSGIFAIFGPTSSYKFYREYLGVKLKSTLISGTKYYLTFHFKLADSSRYASKSLGAFFYKDSISKNNHDTLNVLNQINNTMGFLTIKNSWVTFKGNFVSNGSEKYMYLGNFNTILANDTLAVLGSASGDSQDSAAYYFIDDVCLSNDSSYCNEWSTSVIENEKNNIEIILSPNPSNGIFNIVTSKKIIYYNLYNNFGIRIFNRREFETIIDLSNIEKGIYFVEFVSIEGRRYNQKIIKD